MIDQNSRKKSELYHLICTSHVLEAWNNEVGKSAKSHESSSRTVIDELQELSSSKHSKGSLFDLKK